MNFELMDFPEVFNSAERLVDWNVKEGRKDKTALYYFEEQITYGQVLDKVNRSGNAFASLGLGLEDRVAILTLDCPQFIYALFGLQKLGAVPIGLNTMLSREDYLYMLNDSRAKAIVVSHELYPVIAELKDKLPFLKHVIVVADKQDGTQGEQIEGTIDYNSWVTGFPNTLTCFPTKPDDQAFWLYSSGTTGDPKGIMHSHHTMAYDGEAIGKRHLQMTENDIVFSVARLFFGYGFGNSICFPFYVGAATVLHPGRPLPEHLLSVVDKYKPTMFFGVPTSYNQLLQIPDFASKYDLKSLRICCSGGEPLPGAVWKKWMDITGVEILDCIGSTEVLHYHIGNQIGKSKPDCTGKPIFGYECKLVDENGMEVPQGEQGTLMIKCGSKAIGYWNKMEKTNNTFRGWWVYSGDTYRINEEGDWVYCGRGDDMIKAGGIWVSPAEVEACLMTHPAVLECGVVGVPDQDNLFKPKAFVVFKDGINVSDDLKEEIKKYVKTTIAPYKFPRWIKEIKELPKTPTGKIKRYVLREMDKGEINIDKKDR
ncbi:MAG: benzoate-CoA ligase family protein [Firmicutes bacterium]|nr:benzoate-CoA ligase family protein [Bacillota bacterium]